jgi:hypothetical protein
VLELGRAAESLGDRQQRLDPRAEQLAHGRPLAGLEVREQRLDAVALRRPAVLLDPPRLGGGQRLAGIVALGQPDDQCVGIGGDAGDVGHRRLRVGHAQLERPVRRVRAQLEPPAARVRNRARGHAPAQVVRERLPAREHGRDALA